MMRLSSLAPVLVLLVGCGGGGGDEPDCAADACLVVAPLDDVTDLPSGRIAAAWFGYDGETGTEVAEIAYDVAWSAAASTPITLADLAAPSPDRYEAPVDCGGSMIGPVAIGWILVSTDPDGSGAVDEGEFLDFLDPAFDPTSYGIAQAIIVESPVACDAAVAFPDGLRTGCHIYRVEGESYVFADGTNITLATCAPGTAACDQLDRP